jgi:hypothetical protein
LQAKYSARTDAGKFDALTVEIEPKISPKEKITLSMYFIIDFLLKERIKK